MIVSTFTGHTAAVGKTLNRNVFRCTSFQRQNNGSELMKQNWSICVTVRFAVERRGYLAISEHEKCGRLPTGPVQEALPVGVSIQPSIFLILGDKDREAKVESPVAGM